MDEVELRSVGDKPKRSSIHSTEALLDAALTDDSFLTDEDDARNGVEANGSNGAAQAPVLDDVDESAELSPPAPEDDISRFMAACQMGDLAAVEQFIKDDPQLATAFTDDGITGLHWAAINNRLSVVRLLVESGADANALGGELQASPLHWACRNGLVYIVDYLLTHGNADPRLRDGQSYNSLHLSVHSSNITLVIYLLLVCCDPSRSQEPTAVYIDEVDDHQRTSLHWAAYQGDIMTINALLRFGADVTKRDDQQFIPLHWAFMRGQRNTLSRLVEAGSDIFAENNAGKDSFAVARDMNCEQLWLKTLREEGRTAKNNYAASVISPRGQLIAKVVTFFAPYLLLPFCFAVLSFGLGLFVPKLFLAIVACLATAAIIVGFVAPVYIREEVMLAKTPFLAGVFSGTAFWAIVSFLWVLFPNLWRSHYFTCVAMAVVIGVFSFCFYKTMMLNPGYVPIPADNQVILSQVRDLIKAGRFDTDDFDVNTFVRKPLRSRYSRHSRRLIARYDHYCPWVYNEVGVRNHKLFLGFVYALNLAILLFSYLTLAYFNRQRHAREADGYDSDEDECWLLSEDMCYGFRNHHFLFNLMVWCCLQYVWLTFVTVVQSFQVLRGVTTWELAHLQSGRGRDSTYNHSTVPSDFGPKETNVHDLTAPKPGSRNQLNTCMRILGIDQFVLTVKMYLKSTLDESDQQRLEIPTDFGPKQNWIDFWVLGEPDWRNVFLLPIEGEANLDGQVVDYYHLYSYPERA
ncbi:hypothetical protein DIURU_002961 [Diutina rugosa]|uniref:Palmitoyltransferase n=1 Tax=Diutina rugosa TaxID=5481 RepID=A0A642UMS8_DIURU|nr:uncharacterized protein DIURU_002961 [Diutina rugosa]KAA8902167.1 hypothetical protein DIURU_002961 [Diutina rugosa]